MSYTGPDVVVVGYLPSLWIDAGGSGSGGGGGSGGGNPPYGDTETAEGGTVFVGNIGWYPPEQSDEAEIRVDLNVNRVLTASELQAYEAFVSRISDASVTIFGLPDAAKVTLANGRQVSGAELKQIWEETDFTINDVGHQYANGTFRGEADYNDGDPHVS